MDIILLCITHISILLVFSTDSKQISQQMIPVEAEIHAIDLKTNSNPQSNPKTTDMDIKYENAASDENRHIRNLFANAINQGKFPVELPFNY